MNPVWYLLRDLNPRHLVCNTSVLATELSKYNFGTHDWTRTSIIRVTTELPAIERHAYIGDVYWNCTSVDCFAGSYIATLTTHHLDASLGFEPR